MTTPSEASPRGRGLLRWCFEHRENGQIVVAQWPNLPFWIFIIGFLVQVLLRPAGRLGIVVLVVTAVGLAWWALDEMIRGCNPWRRLLGATVLAFGIYRLWPMLGF